MTVPTPRPRRDHAPWVPWLVGLLLAGAGCAARPPQVTTPPTVPTASPPPRAIELEPLRIEVGRDGHPEVFDARGLLDEGNDALMQRRWDEALRAYEQLVRDFPDSQLVASALYNAGLALEGQGDMTGAADRYRALIERAGTAPIGRDGRFRLAAVLAEAQKFADSTRVLEEVLAATDLPAADRIEALARLGYALIEQKDYAGAEEVLRSAIAYHRDVSARERVEDLQFVAMCQYYLADIAHRQFLEVPMRYPEAQLSRDVDQKSELMLLARDRYIKTVDFKHAYWATAAVFQIGLMYKEFWDAFMAVPIPTDLETVAIEEYVKAVNKEPQLRKLMEKSLLYHERNIAMVKNANLSTVWSEASVQGAEVARKVLGRQDKGELLRPGTTNAADLAAGIHTAPGPRGAPEPVEGAKEYVPGRFDL